MNELQDLRKKNILVFDIETAGGYKSFSDLKANNPSLSDEFIKKFSEESMEKTGLTDPEESLEVTYQSHAALYPEYGRVLCCSFTTMKYDETFEKFEYNTKSFQSTDEKELLEKVNEVFSNNGWTPAGMNIGNFDIPFLLKRMMANSITPTQNLLRNVFAKPWERSTVDLADIWAFGGFKQASLGTICGALGVETPKGGVWGPLVPKFYWTGQCPEVYDEKTFEKDDALNIITEYCEKDTYANAQCLGKLNQILFK